LPDPASTRSPRSDDSVTSPAWAFTPSGDAGPDFHDAATANTPATGGAPDLADYGLGIGRVVGRYKIVRELGKGGNGHVYAATHIDLGKTDALKFLKVYSAAQPQLATMLHEAQTLAALRHPGIVSVLDFAVYEVPRADAGASPGSPPVVIPYIVMEYIPSESTLGQWARAETRPLAELLRVGAEICDAVEHAHEHGVIHRDLKPGNILIDRAPDGRPRPRVIDFGLSQILAGMGSGSARSQFDRVTGTLLYMPPEQLSGNPLLVDHRSDVYALGVVLYEMVCGRLPHCGAPKLPGEIAHEILHGNPVRPSTIRPELKGPIEDMLLRALEKDPARRHPRAGDLADDIRNILSDKPLSWRAEPVAEKAGRAARALTARSRVLISLAAAVMSTLAACALWSWGGAWAPMTTLYNRLVTYVGGAPTVTSIDNVRVIEIRDGLDIETLGAAVGVTGVSNSRPRSLRQLHGHLMEELAQVHPQAVVFDLHFPEASPLDDGAFFRGVKALNAEGIDVVVGVKVVRTSTDRSGQPGAPSAEASTPLMADSIAGSGADWGYIQFQGAIDEPLSIPLVTRQDGYVPSLAMRAVTAARWPRTRVEFEALEDPRRQTSVFDPAPATLHVRCYARPEPAGPERLVATESYRVSTLGSWDDKHTALGFAKDDESAWWTVSYPPKAALTSAARSYAEVLVEPVDTLRVWARNKIVLIGDARPASGDRGDFGTFTDTPYVLAHAAAIESLSKDVALRYPTTEQTVWTSLLGAVIGAGLGFALCGVPRLQVVVGIGVALALTAGSVFLYSARGIVANPFVLVAALLVAMALTAGLSRLGARGIGALREQPAA
jgi:hypothetical protein